MADDDKDSMWLQSQSLLEHVDYKWPTTKLMQHFGLLGLHASSQSSGHD
jgi:hypothetical protein